MSDANRRGRAHLLIVLVAAVALALRLTDIDRHSLWFDEALEFGRASGSLVLALFGRSVDQDPPLLALAYRPWLRLGTTEWWLRAPSALLGAATAYVAGTWALLRLGRRTGVLAAVVFALAPVAVHYGQELNQYAAVLLLSTVLLVAWDLVARRGGSADWRRYGAVTAVAFFTHYGMAFPVASMSAHLAWRVARRRDGPQARRLLAYAAAVTVVLLLLLALGLAERLPTWHLQRRFGGTYVGKELAYVGDMLWREVLVYFLLPFSGGPSLWLVRALVAIALAGAVALWRSDGTGRRVVGVAFIGALAAVYPADGFGLYPIGHRYVLFAAPAFFLALAAGLDWLIGRSRPAGWAALVATCMAFIAFAPQERLANPWLSVPREELRPVLAQMRAMRRPGDLTYVYFGAEPAFRYYAPRDVEASVLGRHLGSTVTPDLEARRIEARAGGRPVWMVLAHERAGDRASLVAAIERGGRRITAEITGKNAAAVRFERAPDG